jgi:hypothetical protein
MNDSTEAVMVDGDTTTVGRRGAMAKLFAITVGLMTGAAVLQADPASATSGTMVYGAINDAGSNETELRNTIAAEGNTLVVRNQGQGHALYVQTDGPSAVVISGGITGTGTCVEILSGATSGNGVNLYHTADDAGLRVERNNSAVAGAAIDAISDDSGPVYRATSQEQCGEPLFEGTHRGFGAGMQLTLESTTSAAHVIDANQNGIGPAIAAAITNTSSHGNCIKATTNGSAGGAIYGDGGAHARGATLVSNVAQMCLTPGTLATHPASGAAGDLYVDKSTRLWFCKGGTAWHQLA